MSGQHTPGPWNDGRTEVLVRGCQRVGLNLAFVNTSNAKKGAEAEANARLIAAAPATLEALTSATDILCICQAVFERLGMDARAEAVGEEIADARPAIAAATHPASLEAE